MRPVDDEVKAWLLKGKNDLISAQILLKGEPPVFDTACFHCQQAVEKVWSYIINALPQELRP